MLHAQNSPWRLLCKNFSNLWHFHIVFKMVILFIFAALWICPYLNLQSAFTKQGLMVNIAWLISLCIRVIFCSKIFYCVRRRRTLPNLVGQRKLLGFFGLCGGQLWRHILVAQRILLRATQVSKLNIQWVIMAVVRSMRWMSIFVENWDQMFERWNSGHLWG